MEYLFVVVSISLIGLVLESGSKFQLSKELKLAKPSVTVDKVEMIIFLDLNIKHPFKIVCLLKRTSI